MDDEQWYSQLITQYTPYVTAVIGGIGRGRLDAGDVEEAAADVFFKVWRKRDQLREDHLKAFIAQVARNTAVDFLRQKRMDTLPFEEDAFPIQEGGKAEDFAILQEQKQIAGDAVRSLKEPDREIFIRFYYFGEPVKAIADKLMINPSTIKTKLSRARSKLREVMRERGYGRG